MRGLRSSSFDRDSKFSIYTPGCGPTNPVETARVAGRACVNLSSSDAPTTRRYSLWASPRGGRTTGYCGTPRKWHDLTPASPIAVVGPGRAECDHQNRQQTTRTAWVCLHTRWGCVDGDEPIDQVRTKQNRLVILESGPGTTAPFLSTMAKPEDAEDEHAKHAAGENLRLAI